MNFLAFAGAVLAVVGGTSLLAVRVITLRRRHPLMLRGRAERYLVLLAGLVGGPLPLLLIGWASGGAAGPNLEEAGMVGLGLAMPASTVSSWVTGELLSGPTRLSWLPMVIAFVCTEPSCSSSPL